MIAPPARLATIARPAFLGSAVAETESAESVEAQTALDARIRALVARVQTPEDEALERQREEFDLVTRVQAESDRELNALRDMAMEQMKHEDELLKKWIELI